jgi:plastocyanin
MKTLKLYMLFSFLLMLNEWNFAQTFHYVVVGNNYFYQPEITIQVGDTVRWINGVDGGGVHNVVADDGSFTSGSPAFPWVYDHVFSTAGTFPYQCSEHGASGMTGTITVESATYVKEDVLDLNDFALYQNYPNPFNPITKIRWQSPISGHQTLKIFDVLGNIVTTLVDEYRNAGSYEVEFNAKEFSSGIYFYQLKAGEFIETKKLTLLK